MTNVSLINGTSPLGKALQEVAEARHDARSHVIAGILAHDLGLCAEARLEGQRAVVSGRHRVLAPPPPRSLSRRPACSA